MGHKIITEKDFWICTLGAVPAQLQSTQLVTFKQSGEKYITVRDKATSSWIDFGCTKYILLIALAAVALAFAAVAVGLITVATGGLGLIAIGALAGLAGGFIGAVEGGLRCGQKMAPRREWQMPKSDFKILGADTITGDCTMSCPAGGTVKFAPNIKSWWQAIGVGAANYFIKLAESAAVGGMAGALVPAVVPLFTGGATLAAPTLGSVWANFAGSFGGAFGAFRGLSAIDQLPNRWAAGELNSAGAVGQTMLYGGVPEAEFAHRVATGGSVRPGDALLLLYLVNLRAKAPTSEPPSTPREEPSAPKDEPTAPKEEEAVRPVGEGNAETAGSGRQGEFEAFEDSPRYGERRISDELYDELRSETPTQEIRDMVNEGIELPMPDPALPGLEITKNLHADHIVPMDKITRMEGFDGLTREQQLAVLNNPDNFIGLSESANTSKGPKTYEQWTRHKSRGIDVEPEFRQRMIERERQLERQLQQQIDEFNRQNQ